MTDRAAWGHHVIKTYPEVAKHFKEMNLLFEARVIKMEVLGDPLATLGEEYQWMSTGAITPYQKPEKVKEPIRTPSWKRNKRTKS